MALRRLANLWLAALAVTVALSYASAATTTSPGTTEDDIMGSTALQDGMREDVAPQDEGTDDTGSSTNTVEANDAIGDSDTDEVPTGSGAAAEADASVGDDVEEAVDDRSSESEGGDDGDEGKAGTGKRSVGDTVNSIKEKFKEQKEKFDDFFERNKQKVKETVAGWSETIKNKFNGLSIDVKNKIFDGDVKGLTEDEINTLSKSQLRLLVPVSRLAGLNSTVKQRLFQRFKSLNDGNSMRRVLEAMDDEERTALITRIKDVNDKLPTDRDRRRLVAGLADRLGDPANWTAAEVDTLKERGVLQHFPPARLTAITQSDIINKIDIPSRTERGRMEAAMQKAWADFILHKKLASKAAGEWTASDIDSDIKESLGKMRLSTLRMMKNASLYEAFATAPASSTGGDSGLLQMFEPAQGRHLAEVLMSEFKKETDNPSPTDVKSFVSNRLRKLTKFVQPEELLQLVDSTMREQTADIADLINTAFANKDAPRDKRCDAFKRTKTGVNLASFTSSQVQQLASDGSLACVPLKYLKMWIKDNKLTDSQISPDNLSSGQLRAIARTALDLTKFKKTDGSLDLARLPAPLLSAASATDMKNADWSNLRSKITLGAKLTKSQRALVVQKGTPDQIVDADLGPAYTELVPVADLKGLTPAKKKMAAIKAAPDSPLRMLSADDPETALPDAITSSNADKLYQTGLPFFSAADVAGRISKDDIQEVLEKLREQEDGDSSDMAGIGGMSPTVCSKMKESLANYTRQLFRDEDDDASILGTITGAELAALPPCVVGRLRFGVVKDEATPDQKMGILSSLGQLKPSQLQMMSKRNCQGLVTEALKAMRPAGDLTIEEAGDIGTAATCLDGGHIRRLDRQAFDALRMYFQDGCLDKDQADAVVDQLISHYGRPEGWADLEPLCGLLPLMDDSRLREVGDTRLATACGPAAAAAHRDPAMQRFHQTAQMVCKRQMSEADHRQMMERKMNMGRRVALGIMAAQKELMDELNITDPTAETAATRRRRRSAEPPLTCSLVEAADGGAEPWSQAQLQNMATNELKTCQRALGSAPADQDKLKVVWTKLKEAYVNDANKVPMNNIGYIATAIPTADIKKLDLSSYDAVSAVGQKMMMSEEQLTEMAARAKSQFSGLSGEPASYTADNLFAAGQLICGMEADSVAQIPQDELKSAMTTLREVEWCPPAVTEKLAAKALQLNGGDPAQLSKAEVFALGGLVGGLEAADLKKIPAEAMAGLTAAGMKSIPPGTIAVMTAEQVSSLSKAAALSVSQEQRAKLPADAMAALQAVVEDSPAPGGGAQHVAATLLPALLACAVVRLV